MKLIIFDIDGTLLYSNRIDSKCFATTYEEFYQRPFPTLDWTYFPHVTDTTIFGTLIKDHFGREVEAAERDAFEASYVEKLQAARAKRPADFREVPGAADMIAYLQQQADIAVAIGTGGWLRPARVKLGHIGVDHERLVVSAADGHVRRESILEAAITKTEQQVGSIDRIVYVGDAVWDVHTTRNMNLPFIGIRRMGDAAKLLDLGAAEVLTDFSDRTLFLDALARAEPPKLV
ncbi:MAG: HAD hydrolase-like protein [Bacteroidota bacterium]